MIQNNITSINVLSQLLVPSLKPTVQKTASDQIKQIINLQSNGNYGMQYNHVYNSRYQKISRRFQGLHLQAVSSIVGQATVAGIIKKKYKKLQKKVGSKKSAMTLETQQYVEPHLLYGENDIIEIEDKSGKIQIQINSQTVFHYNSKSSGLSPTGHSGQHIPFGVYVAIKGYLNKDISKFICQHIYFPQYQHQQILEKQLSNLTIDSKKQCYIVIVNNLNYQTYKKLIKKYKNQREYFCQDILVLCGDLLEGQEEGSRKYQYIDQCLHQLAQLFHVVVLPDRKQQEWPHKPIPSFFLKRSSSYIIKPFNPTILKIHNFQIVVTNGQNISTSSRICDISDPLDIMESHLIYNHIAPFSPSTLTTMPLQHDAFILDSIPRMYICAGQNLYSTRLYENNGSHCRIVTTPSIQDGFIRINSKNLDISHLEL